MPNLVRFPVKKHKLDLSLKDRAQFGPYPSKRESFMEQYKWKNLLDKLPAQPDIEKVDLLQDDPQISVWQSRQRKNIIGTNNQSLSKLHTKKGLEPYLSENGLRHGDESRSLDGSKKEHNSKFQKSVRNSLMELELQEVKSTIIESKSHISGQDVIDA